MTEKYSIEEAHRYFAGRINGEVWGYLSKPDRSEAESERMVYAAHASCYHWLQVGTVVNHQRGEWLIARVYSELGWGKVALRHARRCYELTQQHSAELADFDWAYAYECMARAYAVSGRWEKASHFYQLAQKTGTEIEDEESRRTFTADLKGGHWSKFQPS